MLGVCRRALSTFVPCRGTRDYIADDHHRLQGIIAAAKQTAHVYGYDGISTPILEDAALFRRGLGQGSDIVAKEMFTLQDKGGKEISLRPEGTAGCVRAFINAGVGTSSHLLLPVRWCYDGPMFRYERPQRGRMRQFHQVGVELFRKISLEKEYSIEEIYGDVEVISMVQDFLMKIGLRNNVCLLINTLGDVSSRALFSRALAEYLSKHIDKLSDDSVARIQRGAVLRILDSKNESDQVVIRNPECPSLDKFLNEYSCNRFTALQNELLRSKVNFSIDNRLVRGLDYYDHTVFEFVITSNEFIGSHSTVVAGGCYNRLIGEMGGPSNVGGVGWAAGVERLLLATSDTTSVIKSIPNAVGIVLVPPTSATCHSLLNKAVELKASLRLNGYRVIMDNFMNNENKISSLSKQLDRVRQRNIHNVIILGEDEVRNKTYSVKSFCKSSKETIQVNYEQLLSFLNTNI